MQLPNPAIHAQRPLNKQPQLRLHRLKIVLDLVVSIVQIAQLGLVALEIQVLPLVALLWRGPPGFTVFVDL